MEPPSGQTTFQTKGNSGAEKYANFNWDELGFGPVPTDYMYVMKCCEEENFSHGNLIPYGNIEMSPSAGILNYGQGVFEGLKAYRKEDGCDVLLFRPEQNAQRMKNGAERLCMPSPSVEQFVEAVKQTVIANKHWLDSPIRAGFGVLSEYLPGQMETLDSPDCWQLIQVPPPGKGSLYIRPLLIGTGPHLSLGPAPEYTFLIYVVPVGNYHKGLLNLVIEDKFHRAAPGGTGGVKATTNYSPVYKALTQAKAKGFSDVLFLDALTGKNIEEVTTCNIFIVKGNVISTPAILGTILPGITRKSIIEIALSFGYQVEERVIPVEDLLEADELFCTGTAVVVSPVASVTYHNKRVEYKIGAEMVSQKIHVMLAGIQTGRIEDKMGWTIKVD